MRHASAIRALAVLAVLAGVATGCSTDIDPVAAPGRMIDPPSRAPTPTAAPTPRPEPTTGSTPTPLATPTPARLTIRGTVVSSIDGMPLPETRVRAGTVETHTDAAGAFVLAGVDEGQEIVVERPVWHTATIEAVTGATAVTVELDPRQVRALRVSREVAGDPAAFGELLALADATTVNTLVFDTKDEDDTVLYRTAVPLAVELGAVDAVYDPRELIARARERGLYTVTRIVTFEDERWAEGVPEARLLEDWVDAADPENWEYPVALAVEACQLGFDEIQFDYVRFPSGEVAGRARGLVPPDEAERTAAVGGFLEHARSALHPLGCGVSAAIFGIVMSSADDQRLGQTPEAVSAAVDAVSPMLYPSHYSEGWLGFADPNVHPGPVVAHSLDQGIPRVGHDSLVRPWIQAFGYSADQVLAQIREAEARGAGWILWNARGRYERAWLPATP